MQLLPSFLVSVVSCSGSLRLLNLVIVKFKVLYQDIVLSEYYVQRYHRYYPWCALFHSAKHKILPNWRSRQSS